MAHVSWRLGTVATIGLFMAVYVVGMGPAMPSLAAERVQTTRLYVLDGGTLTIADPSGFGVTIEDVKGFSAMPVPAYLVVHPAGTLLWDAGLER